MWTCAWVQIGSRHKLEGHRLGVVSVDINAAGTGVLLHCAPLTCLLALDMLLALMHPHDIVLCDLELLLDWQLVCQAPSTVRSRSGTLNGATLSRYITHIRREFSCAVVNLLTLAPMFMHAVMHALLLSFHTPLVAGH